MTEKITDLPGLSEWEKYNGVDIDGKHFSPSQVASDEGLSALMSGKATTIYDSVNGGYTYSPSKAVTSFSWDSDTGKIKISAPKSVQDADWFKERYTDNANFKALAAAFKSDPTGSTSLTVYDKDGNAQQKTIEDMLNEEKKAFEEYSKQYREVLAVKDEVRNRTGGGINLTDNDLYIYTHSTKRENDKYDSQKVVYIPNIAMNYFDFSTISSWNPETNTISAKDFYEWYNLDDGTEHKDELINRITDATAQMYNQYNQTQRNLSPEERDDDTVSNDYARTVSFLRTLQADNPEANVFTSLRLFTASAANSFVDNLYQTTGNVVLAVSDFIDGLDAADEVIVPLKLVTEPLKFGRGMYQTGELMFYDLGATLAGVDIDAANRQLNEVALIGDVADSLADGDAKGLLDIISENKGLSRNLSARDMLEAGHNWLLEAHDDMTRLSSAATAGMIIGGLAAEALKQVAITNVFGKAAEAYFPSVLSGLGFIEKGLTAEQLSGAVKFGAFSANILAQGLSDTILNDEAALRKMVMEGDPLDAVVAFSLNTGFNLVGELSGLATTKGWDALTTKTTVGRAVDAWGSRRIASIQYRKQRALASVAEKLNSMKKTPDEGAELMTQWAKAEANASEKIAHASKNMLEGETITDATKRLVQEKVDLEKSFTRVNVQTGRTVLQIQTDARVSKQWLATQTKQAKVISLEGALGIGEKGAKTFTQETANYFAFTKRIQELSHKETLTQAEAAFKTALEGKVSNFKLTHSKEFLDAVDDYTKSVQQYTHDFMDMLIDEKLLTPEQIEAIKKMRASGLWGEDGIEYVHLQTIKTSSHLDGAKELINNMASGKNYHAKIDMEQYSYKVGDIDANYLDPQLTLLSQQIAIAKVADSREWADALIKTQPFVKEIDLNGNPVTAKELNNLRSETRSAAKNIFKKYSSDDTILEYEFANIYKSQENLQGKITKKQEKVSKLLDMDEDRLTQTALDLEPIDVEYLRIDMDLPEYLPLKSQEEFAAFYDSANAGQKTAIDQAIGTGERTVENYNKALDEGFLEQRLVSEYLAADKKLLNSSTFKKYATDVRKQQLTARQQTVLKDAYKKIRSMQKTAKLVEIGEDEFTLLINTFTDDLTKSISLALDGNAVFEEGIKRFTDAGVDKELAKKYLALDNIRKELMSSSTQFSKTLSKNLENLKTSGNLSTVQKKRFSKEIKKALKENVESELNGVTQTLQKSGAGELIDTEALFNDIRTYMKDIIDTQVDAPNVIRVMTEDGDFKLYEVSPTVAALYNQRPNFSNIKNSGVVRFFNQTNRVFKVMTTGWGLSSFENQWIRDPLDAYVRGGLVRSISSNTEELGKIIGPNVTEAMQKQLDEAGFGQLVKDLPEGADAGKAIAEEVKATAERFYGGVSEETLYYRNMAKARKETLFGDYEKQVGKMEKALEWMESHSLGNFRETYLRKDMYISAYNKALQMGKTVKEAANWAEYVADNATTDFARAFAWGNKITSSVPYLGAAINGTKSFWRLLEIDPVGVCGRMFTGIIIPTMSLVARSVETEEDRKIYRNIPEYLKEDNLCFVVNGSVFKIPIPQELSAFVSPFRQLVEKANDANDEAWTELLLNDIFELSPIELGGLADLDDPLGKDADFWSRLSNEAETLISQISPVAVKTAYMAATGRDPYTHSKINKQYTYIDSDGQLQIMDNEDNALAKWFSSVCKAFNIDLSPSSAEALLSGFFGQAPVDLFGSLGNIFSGDLVGAASVYGRQISKPFTTYSYDQNDSAWKEVVKELQAEKQEIMRNDGELAKLTQQLMYTTDKEKQKTLRAQIRQITQAYQDKVFNTVQKFNSIYGANYDYKKFASTINLLNFTNTASGGISDAALQDARELASDNKNYALMTMSEMGFNSTNDYSIFGYLVTDSKGNTEWKATLPTSIVYSQGNTFYAGLDETTARLTSAFTREKLMNGKTIKEAYQEMWKRANAYADKGKWTARDNVLKDWDIEVMMKIYPILAENDLMDQYGNSLLDNKEVIDLLDDYIRVPSDFMGRGKYISASSGIDKNRGYAKSYVQKIYKQLRGGR